MTEELTGGDAVAEIKLVSKHDFYFETPLYEILKYSQPKKASDLLRGDVDAYSSKNKTETTYNIKSNWSVCLESKDISPTSEINNAYTGFQIITLTCKRKDNDTLRFFVFNDEIHKVIIKVGQLPSIADLQFSDLERKYNKILDKQYLGEFKKAIICVSHGYGVAAFVYLRRIFENLILETFETFSGEFSETKESDFKSMRMEDKINLLKRHLPSQLIEMKSIYGILSLGVHQLDENECLIYFSPLKLSIELILDQKIEEDVKKKREEEVRKQVQQITSKIISSK